ncbi:glucokinase [Thermodesulfobacteriota bacterium]
MVHSEEKTLILAGDIGGTKTNLGLFIKGKRRPLPKVIGTFLSREAPNLEYIVEQFLGRYHVPVTCACFGIAGPVQNGRCKTTNLPWNVYENRLKKRFKLNQVRLINDLEATARAIPYLNRNELFPLNRAKARKGNLALIAPGTGLGEAVLLFYEGRYLPVSSEGGHADLSPNNETEIKLWQHLHKRYGHVSIERVLSGPGIFNIYSWLKDSGRYREPEGLGKRLKETDPAKAITEAAMNEREPLCVKTLDIFVSILGAVSGNLALTWMSTGGLYLGGGIPPKILTKLEEDIFISSFTNKGRFKALMETIPVRVILNDRAALLGAAIAAFET